MFINKLKAKRIARDIRERKNIRRLIKVRKKTKVIRILRVCECPDLF